MVVAIVILVVGLILMYGTYVSLIKKKNKVQEAFSCIDVQLKKRYDLIPNILLIAKKYMEHEKDIFENITKLRCEALNISNNYKSINKKIKLDEEISEKMNQLLVEVENYPQLKSDKTMNNAMVTYCEVEEHIAAARRFFNSAVLELKNAVEIFPSSIFAWLLNIKATEFFKAEEYERQSIDARKYLN